MWQVSNFQPYRANIHPSQNESVNNLATVGIDASEKPEDNIAMRLGKT